MKPQDSTAPSSLPLRAPLKALHIRGEIKPPNRRVETAVENPTYFYDDNKDKSTTQVQEWAILNRTNGTWAFRLTLISQAIDFLATMLPKDSALHTPLKFLSEAAFGYRSHLQYDMYSKDDDDLGFDKTAKYDGKDQRGRPASAVVGQLACNLEKWVNPFVRPLTTLFGDNFREGVSLLSALPNGIWWRMRPSEESIVTDEEVKKEGGFIKALMKKGNPATVVKNFSNMFFGKDNKSRNDSRQDLVTLFQPILGWAGLTTMTIFMPVKAVFKFMGVKNKAVDFFAATAFTTQHALYFLKYTMTDYFKNKDATAPDATEQDKAMNKGYDKLFYTGLAANISNFLLPFISFIPGGEGPTGRLLDNIVKFFPTGNYFSLRRAIRGDNLVDANGSPRFNTTA